MVGVDEQGNMFWNGLWHSKLSANNDHVGTNNWRLAVCAVLIMDGRFSQLLAQPLLVPVIGVVLAAVLASAITSVHSG